MALLATLNPFSAANSRACFVPRNLNEVTTQGPEVSPRPHGATRKDIETLWGHIEDVYRTGMHPALQLCVRRENEIVMNRAIGYAAGNGPDDSPSDPKRKVGLDTPINIFSASKAVTAMLVHKLAWEGVVHLDDWVSDYIPEFARHGKERVTLRHVLAHRSGLPNLPPEALDLDLLAEPERVVKILCDTELRSRPGRILAYHAITGGFVLGAVIERATGKDLRDVLREEIAEPLGLDWFNYGVAPDLVDAVASNASTGPPPPPPLGLILKRALGASLSDCVALSNDARFITSVIPSANIFSTAQEMSVFYQCLLDGGMHEGKQVFDPHCIRHAVAEQSWLEIDFTLIAPIRYGLGFMLGTKRFGLFGPDTEHAFGHIGLSNVYTWADPERKLSVALLNTGKPFAARHVAPLLRFIRGLGSTFGKVKESR